MGRLTRAGVKLQLLPEDSKGTGRGGGQEQGYVHKCRVDEKEAPWEKWGSLEPRKGARLRVGVGLRPWEAGFVRPARHICAGIHRPAAAGAVLSRL